MLSEFDMLSAIDVSFAIGFYYPDRDVIKIIIRERIATQHQLIRQALGFQAPGPIQLFAIPPAWFSNPGYPEIFKSSSGSGMKIVYKRGLCQIAFLNYINRYNCQH